METFNTSFQDFSNNTYSVGGLNIFWGGMGTPSTGNSGTAVNGRVLASVVANGSTYEVTPLPSVLQLRRVNNANVTGRKESVWAHMYDTGGTNVGANPPLPTLNSANQTGAMEDCLNSTIVNRGTDNLFCNRDGGSTVVPTINNVEALDYIFALGIRVADPADAGFVVLERGGNDNALIIRPILALSGGQPSVYGAPVSVTVGTSGGSFGSGRHSIFSKDPNDNLLSLALTQDAQRVYGSLVGFADLGVAANQTIFGFSIFPSDNPTNFDPLTLANARTTTSGNTGDSGGQDVVGGGFFVFRAGSVPVTLSSFQARRRNSQLDLSFQTLSESENIGFQLYTNPYGVLEPLGPIIPSSGGDSQQPQQYRTSIDLGEDRRELGSVYLAAHDIHGEKELYGPFSLNRNHGISAVQRKKIDWTRIRQQLLRQGYITQDGQAVPIAQLGSRKLRQNYANFMEELFGASAAPAPTEKVQVRVDGPGYYRISSEELQEVGFDLSRWRIDDIALTRRGQPVPFDVLSPGRRETFQPGSSLVFFAPELDAEQGLYQKSPVFELSFSPSSHRAAQIARRRRGGDAPPTYTQSTILEKNLSYFALSPTRDPWYWTQTLAYPGKPKSFTTTLDVESPLPPDQSATLTAYLIGVTDFPNSDIDHHVRLYLNNQMVGEANNSGLSAFEIRASLPPGLLKSGPNQIKVEGVGDTGNAFEVVYIDRLQLDTQRSFDAAGQALQFQGSFSALQFQNLPTASVGYAYDGARLHSLPLTSERRSTATSAPGVGSGHYFVGHPDKMLQAQLSPIARAAAVGGNGAQYLVITHSAFAQLPELSAFLATKSLSSRIVTVEDIYRQHSGGEVSPLAIREFLKHNSAQYVLLVGADCYDYKNYSGSGAVSFVPTIYTPTADTNFTPSDGLIVDFDGDRVPDKAIGRWPVRSVDELRAVIAKTETYQQSLQGQPGAVLVAEAHEHGTFTSQLQRVAAALEGWSQQEIFVDSIAQQQPGLSTNALGRQARDRLVQAMNQGVRLVLFNGHGSSTAWSFQGILKAADVDLLQNASAPAVMMPLACYTTSHNSPSTQTLCHRLTTSTKGAVALLGASTLSSPSDNERMAHAVLEGALRRGMTLGQAVLAAKQQLGASAQDVVINWELIGDPALQLSTDPPQDLPVETPAAPYVPSTDS